MGEGNGGRVGGVGGGTGTGAFAVPSCPFVTGLAKRSGVSRAVRELLATPCTPSLGPLPFFAEGAEGETAPREVSWGAAAWFGEGSAEDREGGLGVGEPDAGGDAVAAGEGIGEGALASSEVGSGEVGVVGTGAGGEACEEGGAGVVGVGGRTP